MSTQEGSHVVEVFVVVEFGHPRFWFSQHHFFFSSDHASRVEHWKVRAVEVVDEFEHPRSHFWQVALH
jgi:hypothetical protein